MSLKSLATTDGTWLSRWEPENNAFWQAGGSSLAWRTDIITAEPGRWPSSSGSWFR